MTLCNIFVTGQDKAIETLDGDDESHLGSNEDILSQIDEGDEIYDLKLGVFRHKMIKEAVSTEAYDIQKGIIGEKSGLFIQMHTNQKAMTWCSSTDILNSNLNELVLRKINHRKKNTSSKFVVSIGFGHAKEGDKIVDSEYLCLPMMDDHVMYYSQKETQNAPRVKMSAAERSSKCKEIKNNIRPMLRRIYCNPESDLHFGFTLEMENHLYQVFALSPGPIMKYIEDSSLVRMNTYDLLAFETPFQSDVMRKKFHFMPEKNKFKPLAEKPNVPPLLSEWIKANGMFVMMLYFYLFHLLTIIDISIHYLLLPRRRVTKSN